MKGFRDLTAISEAERARYVSILDGIANTEIILAVGAKIFRHKAAGHVPETGVLQADRTVREYLGGTFGLVNDAVRPGRTRT